jgi:hypothetical protein
MSGWKPEDEVVTTFRTVVQAHHESMAMGWEEAIAMVLGVIDEMKPNFDTNTLEELRQRIV